MTILIKDLSAPDNDFELARRQASEYAMALDLLAKMSHSDTEDLAVENILEIFTVLFAPEKLTYVSLIDGKLRKIYSFPALFAEDNAAIMYRLLQCIESSSWTESANGFLLKIHHKGSLLGIIEVDEMSFPEYKTHYLNLALSIVDICGLAIENARKTEQLHDNEHILRQEKEKLEQALAEVRTLSGLLPICMHCKKIRDDKGYWNQIEMYIQTHSSAVFSHGICQDCLDIHYPESLYPKV